MKLPTLYSRTSLGQVQQWTIEVKGSDYRTHEGIVDGQITTSAWTRCEGKNIGRANETTPERQAELEAASKHKKKRDKGYHADVGKIDEVGFFEPMLAHKWTDYGEDVVWPVASQPKLDGARLTVSAKGSFSRGGKPVVSAPHIAEALAPVFKRYPKLTLDGELYNHDLKHDFDRLMSLARQGKPTAEDLAASRAELQYWVYDCDDGSGKTFAERIAFLRELDLPDYVLIVPTEVAATAAQLDTLYESYLKDGYEGQMVRALQSAYEHKRSRFLLKRKEFVDEEFELVDFEEGRGNRAGMAARAILKLKDGRTFEAGMIGSHPVCIQLLKDKASLIGRMATVQYQNLTPDGIPRFGKFKAMRDNT